MNLLIFIYLDYQIILSSYNGVHTDWKAKCADLDHLLYRLNCLKLKQSNYSGFYEWVKVQLKSEIYAESLRVWKLSCS